MTPGTFKRKQMEIMQESRMVSLAKTIQKQTTNISILSKPLPESGLRLGLQTVNQSEIDIAGAPIPGDFETSSININLDWKDNKTTIYTI